MRKIGKTLAACQTMKLELEVGGTVYLAGKQEYPQNYINILMSLGIEATAEPQYMIAGMDPIYDEGGIIGRVQPEKVLTGYIIKKK